MDSMKGHGKTLLYPDNGRERLHLMGFLDGSFSIRGDGRAIGVWEANQQDDCFRTFAHMARVAEVLDVRIVQILAGLATQPNDSVTARRFTFNPPRESLN